MAKECSFDVVSEIDMQEVDNAINQTTKELKQRFDFRGSKSEVSLDGQDIKVVSDDDFKLRNVIDVLQTKIVKRGISLKNLDYGKVETAFQGTVRQNIKIKKGLDKDIAKKVTQHIKNAKLKVQAQIMEDQVRVIGKNKDDLQEVMQSLKQEDFNIELQFVNFRS